MTIEEKIKLFAELPGDERREVERYVKARGDEHPHLRERLEEAKRLERLLESARVLSADPPGDEALAFYTVMRGVDASRRPDELADAFQELERRVDRSPELQRRVAELDARGEEVQSVLDAERQFARLAGASPDAHGREAAKPRRDLSRRQAVASPDAPPARSGQRLRKAASAALLLAAVYGILFVAGRFTRAEHERIAQFDADELVLEGYEDVRGEAALQDSPTAVYVRALGHLREAERSFLGLFPHYREERLDSAAALLREVVEREPPDSFLAGEANYFLGKTELARGNVEAARRAFEQAGAAQGPRSQDAELLLKQLSDL